MTNKNRNKLYGIITTVVIHATAIVLLFVLCFKTPLPLPGEEGVEVNLGMYETSQQDYETTSLQDQETTSQQVEETEEVKEDNITFEDEEVPAIEEETEEVEEEDTVEKVEEEKPVVNQRAMFKAPVTKNADNDKQSDDKKDDMERGIPEGLKDINRYEGHGGSGDGPAYDLGGRGAKSISSPSKEFSEEGTVVVDIWVDKDGRVQRAEIGKGTTIVNSSMLESAKRAALNSIFNKDDKAAELQKGSITYTFIIRQ
ncbi:MAG: energy transducer TonB [Lentimicrobiaceae bacterium]|nr:energy transducer TonB [Lentimicrobiaceae bacterium]